MPPDVVDFVTRPRPHAREAGQHIPQHVGPGSRGTDDDDWLIHDGHAFESRVRYLPLTLEPPGAREVTTACAIDVPIRQDRLRTTRRDHRGPRAADYTDRLGNATRSTCRRCGERSRGFDLAGCQRPSLGSPPRRSGQINWDSIRNGDRVRSWQPCRQGLPPGNTGPMRGSLVAAGCNCESR